jgi:hypothetical protein
MALVGIPHVGMCMTRSFMPVSVAVFSGGCGTVHVLETLGQSGLPSLVDHVAAGLGRGPLFSCNASARPVSVSRFPRQC